MTIRKLATVPAEGSKVEIEEGNRLTILHYKTVDNVKKPSVAYSVPDFAGLVQSAEATKVDEAIAKFLSKLQDDAVREYEAGDLEAAQLIEDVELLCADYVSDARGTRGGVKQSQLMDWISTVLAGAIVERLKGNAGMPQEKKVALAAALLDQFKIAGSRGNKVGNRSIAKVEVLKDLAGRLVTLSDAQLIDNQDVEYIALQSRISGHVKTIEGGMDVVNDQF